MNIGVDWWMNLFLKQPVWIRYDDPVPYEPVEVYGNDQKVADWQLVADPAEFSASIPQKITWRGGLLRITLKIPKATSPKALGMRADPRILGVACFDLQLALKADQVISNAVGTLNLLEAARQGCREATFVDMSTNKVYGAPNFIRIKELPTRWDYDDPQFEKWHPGDIFDR